MARMAEQQPRWGIPEMIVTIVGVLGGVAIGAWIFWLASGRSRAPVRVTAQYLPPAPAPQLSAPDLAPLVAQIRGLIRAANSGSDPGAAEQARQMLDDAERAYGSALSTVCSPSKLRNLIDRVQARQSA